MLSRARRRPRHAKRAHRKPLRASLHRPHLHLHLPSVHIPKPHLKVPKPPVRIPRPRLRMPSSPVPPLQALLARWRGGQAKLSLERRRARTMLAGAIVLAAVVLLTSFPISGLLHQRSALSSTSHELTVVRAQNQSLSRQVADLADPTTINGLARHDYGFVLKGQSAYDVLPSSSPSGAALSASDEVPLGGPPVVPGSARSQALIGIVAPLEAVRALPATSPAHGSASGSDEAPEPRSYWGRVVRSLEFWN